MKPGWPHRGVLLAGLGSLAVSGAPGLAIAVATLCLIVSPGPRLSGNGWAVAHGAVLLATGLTAAVASPTLGFAILVGWLLAHRGWMGRSPDDLRVALLLATLLLLLGAVGSETVLLAPLLVLYAALLPVALLRAELRGSAPRGVELALGTGAALLAGLLFAVLPRLDGGYLGRGQLGGQRFPDDVTLGEEGLVSEDGAEVLRVRVTGPDGRPVPGPFHLRGRALDRFDGTRWSVGTPIERAPLDAPWDRRAEVWLEPIGGDVLFGVPDVLRVDGLPVRAKPGGAFAPLTPGRAVHYTAYGRDVPLERVDDTDIEPWLQLPPTLDGRVTSLAWSVVPAEEGDPAVVARALSDWLATTYRYVESPPPPEGDPLAWFLFEAKEGHCEYFASALTVLLRARGVPARLATGFHSGELAEDGTIVVRRGNAHAWVEVRTAAGWATLDPTPASALPTVDGDGLRARLDALVAAWYRDIVEYDMQAQFAAYGAVGKRVLVAADSRSQSPIRAGLVGMVVVVVALAVTLLGARGVLGRLGGPRSARLDAGARLCADARRIVRRRGWALPAELPMLEAATWLEARAGAHAAPFRRLGELVYAARYGGGPLATGEARACLAALRRLPRPGSRAA